MTNGRIAAKYTIRLCQKALEDGLLRFLRGETQRLQLQQLIPGDLADGGLVDQLGVRTVGGDGGNGLDVGLSHEILASPMMMESHCTWPKHWLLPTITGWNT